MLYLRGLVILLLLLAFWGPSLPLAPVRTVVLLDQSPSAREAVWQLAPRLELPGAQYVAFASGAVEVAAPTARRLDLGEGTRLEEALKKAMELKPDRIVLVSDGLFQDEPLPPKVPLYALYQPPSPYVALSLVGPALPLRGETVEVRAVLEATAPTEARLTLEGPAGRLSRRVELAPGRQSLGYRFRLEEPAVVRARLESPLGDREARLELSPSDATRVWVLGDAALARYLRAQGFLVEERQEVALPIRAEVVALGVGARDLSAAELDALQSFLQQGGSLLWTATPRGLFFGGWERSSLADSLPLEPVEEPGGMGIVLVLDVSGSMLEADKLGLAVVGALELVRSARSQDYIGVVLFSDRPRWLFRPRPMTEQGRREAESLLLSIEAGGGTMIRRAYLEALEALEDVPTKSKQVIALTDGLVADAAPEIFEAARRASPEIKTSTVAIGADADRRFLRELAEAGGGSFWDVPRPQDLPRFFLEEAQRAFRREVLEGRFPVTVRPHPVSRGTAPPPVSVLLPARAKPWAQAVLTSGEGVILAVGESGRGRVAALATDLSRSWQEWSGASRLAAELVRWLAQTPARPRVQALREEGLVRVVLEGQFERPVLRAFGREQPFMPVGPLRYEARLPRGAVGQAVVLDGEPRLRLELPALPEWRLEDGQENLRRLAEASGGRLLADPAELRSLPGRKGVSLQLPLIALALLLFLLERYLEHRRLVPLAKSA
ncbi:VWA domain-containing protein [Meiothermus sp. QL-1]|uniref:VWA domain-containing protein n=1 Tax=Meiothermus sp. QL-1 TaxID=2058095 RepID=UPI000E0C0940|nr:VWA domain-containing protein [Meiothermus sp. QL-1]RDI94819.1 VWA domain-containing protein [Meiothermus sp. QL-1]